MATTAAGPERPRRSAVRALRHRNYQLFFVGQLVSLIGTWMQSVAQSWLVYRLTGSSLLLGAVSFASQVPVFVVAPIGGAVADRVSRRRILLATQIAAMLLALGLGFFTLSGRIRVAHLFFFGSALGIVNAFDIPARQAFVVEMVGPDDLGNAIALNSSVVNGARLLGPAIAGVLVGAVGEGWCFVANGLSYVAAIAALAAMTLIPRALAPRRASALADIVEGFRYVAQDEPTRALLFLLGAVSLFGMSFTVLMPIFADRILHGGPSALGILMAASGGGALVGALTLAARSELRGIGRWVAWAGAAFGVSLVAFAFSRWFWLSVLLLIPGGAAMMIAMAGCNTVIQTLTPDAMRGRVMAVYVMMFMGSAPFGALAAGWAAEHIGPPATVAAGGVMCIAAALLFGWRLPVLTALARQVIERRRATR
jgi:MFS family permease